MSMPKNLHRKLLYHFSATTAALFTLFGAIYLSRASYPLGLFELLLGVGQLANIIYIYRGGNNKIAARVLVASIYIMSLIIYILGGIGNTGFLWILFMPISTTLLINPSESGKWLLFYSVTIVSIIVLHTLGHLPLPYEEIQIYQSLLVYILFVHLTYNNERLRKAAGRKLREQEELMIQHSKMAAMGEMIEVIAHQWRQPLNISSLGISKIQMERELGLIKDEDETRTLNQIAQQIELLSNTIDDFRSFFKKDKEKQRVFLNDIIDEVRSLLGSTLKHRGITCRVNHRAPIQVELYTNELKQVLLNIVNNAKDAIASTDPEEKTITIETSREGPRAVIRICDSGGGIAPQIIERIFEPYFTTKPELQGTGIGLYLSRIIIEKNMQGSIYAENSGKGACFVITLPADTAG